MEQNNIPADNQQTKWEVKEWGEESYAITNGKATLVTSDASDDGYLSAIVDLLNASGYRFHSESKIEIDLHCEAEMCKLELSEWKEIANELEAEAERAQKQIKKLLNTLETIVHAPVPANEREYISWFVTAKNIAGGAISEYEADNEMQQWKDRK